MPFKTLLSATQIGTKDGREVWKLDAPLVYETKSGLRITVPRFFETDFASVPRVPIIFDMFGDRCDAEATLHDYAYRSDSGFSKEYADALFLEAMESKGVSSWISWPMFKAVSLFGGPSYHKMKINQIYELDEK